MDNLEGKFKAVDAARRKDSADDFRLTEVKARLVFKAERSLSAHLRAVAGAKILNTKIDNLSISENQESSTPSYSGKIIAQVAFLDGTQEKIANVPVNVNNSEVDIVAKDVKDALTNATLKQEAPVASSSSVVTAALNGFKVVDDGTRYLKVYHTAAYGDLEAIGAVSKEEYNTADKKQLLSEMLKDEAVSWPADVNFVGEFAEPAVIEAHAVEEARYVVKAETRELPAGTEDDLAWKDKIADTSRLAAEATQKNYDTLKSRVTQRALSAFTDAWKTRGTGNVKVKNTSSSWEPESGVGDITIEAEVLDGKETKLVPFKISVSGNNMKLPDFANLSAMLKEAKVVSNEITGENVKKNVALTKKATPMSPNNTGFQEVVRLPKDFLPASLKEGDVIEVDGLHYKLASKSEGQLSKEKDTASYWTFLRCPNGDGPKPVYKQDAY
jgi:hypothetical protein